MTIRHGEVSVEVEFIRDNAGNWHFTYDIPNYGGSGEKMRIKSDMEFESEEAAKKHAQSAIQADLAKNQTEIDQRQSR